MIRINARGRDRIFKSLTEICPDLVLAKETGEVDLYGAGIDNRSVLYQLFNSLINSKNYELLKKWA